MRVVGRATTVEDIERMVKFYFDVPRKYIKVRTKANRKKWGGKFIIGFARKFGVLKWNTPFYNLTEFVKNLDECRISVHDFEVDEKNLCVRGRY